MAGYASLTRPWLCPFEHSRLRLQDCGCKTGSVRNQLTQHGYRRWIRRFDFADHGIEIAPHFSIEFSSKLLHALIFQQTSDVQLLDATVARRQQDAFEQFGAHAVALPRPFDAKRGLGLRGAERTQLSCSPQNSVGEEPPDNVRWAKRRVGMIAHERIGNATPETVASADRVEP